MKLFLVLLLVLLGAALLTAAAMVDGGVITAHDAGWLLPGGLAALALAWLASLLPAS